MTLGKKLKANRMATIYSAAAGIAGAVSVVLGLMVENPGQIAISATLTSITILSIIAVLGAITCALAWPRLLPLFPIVLYGMFQLRSLDKALPQIPFSSAITFFGCFVALFGLYMLLRKTSLLVAARGVFFVSMASAAGTGVVVAPEIYEDLLPTLHVVDREFTEKTLAAITKTVPSARKLPDIIYIIPDRYPNNATLLREYGYDNSKFFHELRKRGFAIAENAFANYPKTFASVASTSNGGYINSLKQHYGPQSPNKLPVFRLLINNIVQNRLRRAGYRYLHMGNWWDPAWKNPHADENFLGYLPTAPRYLHLPQVEQMLLKKSLLTKVIAKAQSPSKTYECERVKNQLNRLHSVGNTEKPVFAYFHGVIPHPPILTTSDGSCLPKPINFWSAPWPEFKSAFVNFMEFFNQEILEIIDKQRQRRGKDGRDLIFVIQSDEGPFPKALYRSYSQPQEFDYFEVPERELRMKLGNINAMLMPPNLKPAHNYLQTPINNWRIIFNAIFNAQLKMLPHKIYVHRDNKHVYDYKDVSYLLAAPGSGAPAKQGIRDK
jgi:hypothetical protein